MTAYIKNVPALPAGEVTRKESAVIEAGKLADGVVAGDAVVYDSNNGNFGKFAGTGTPYGVVTRIAPQSPDYAGMAGILVHGYVAVVVAAGDPVRGGKVYLTAAGGFTATATSNTEFPNAVWAVDGKSDGNLAEIRIL